MSDDEIEQVNEAIVRVIDGSDDRWRRIDTQPLPHVERMAILLCTWSGLAECQLDVEAWTDHSTVKTQCVVCGYWITESRKSMLVDEIKKCIPAWKGLDVKAQPSPILEFRLTLEGQSAKRSIHRGGMEQFAPAWFATTNIRPGRATVRILSTEDRAPGVPPPKSPALDFSGMEEKLGEIVSAIRDHTAATPMDELVTLNQASGISGVSKRQLERYLAEGKLPGPEITGVGGRSSKWYWSKLRPALEPFSTRPLPVRFPSSQVN